MDTGFLKCPLATAPDYTLAHRARCSPSGVPTAIVSSARPLRIGLVCDNVVMDSKDFKLFPVRIETECEISEISNDSRKPLLPQFHSDFLQNQKIENIATETPFSSTLDSETDQLEKIPPTGIWRILLDPVPLSICGVLLVILCIILTICLKITCKDPENIRHCLSCCIRTSQNLAHASSLLELKAFPIPAHLGGGHVYCPADSFGQFLQQRETTLGLPDDDNLSAKGNKTPSLNLSTKSIHAENAIVHAKPQSRPPSRSSVKITFGPQKPN
jgi:hypothetical protein